jgi:serralysin
MWRTCGKGDDTYVIDSAFETITEKVGEGKDTVETGLNSYTLGANLENLTHTAGTPFTGTGNALDNVITGGTGPNILSGLDGNDRLISGGDFDTMIGGKGDDVYIDAGTHITITELAGQGTDTLATSLNTETLAANVENLFYTGSGIFHGTGNASNNIIVGGGLNDLLQGLGGNDTLFGGLGDDVFRFANGNGKDVVHDFAGQGIGGLDVIEIHTANIADVTELFASHLSQKENGVLVTIDAADSILLLGYKLADLQMADFFVGP